MTDDYREIIHPDALKDQNGKVVPLTVRIGDTVREIGTARISGDEVIMTLHDAIFTDGTNDALTKEGGLRHLSIGFDEKDGVNEVRGFLPGQSGTYPQPGRGLDIRDQLKPFLSVLPLKGCTCPWNNGKNNRYGHMCKCPYLKKTHTWDDLCNTGQTGHGHKDEMLDDGES